MSKEERDSEREEEEEEIIALIWTTQKHEDGELCLCYQEKPTLFIDLVHGDVQHKGHADTHTDNWRLFQVAFLSASLISRDVFAKLIKNLCFSLGMYHLCQSQSRGDGGGSVLLLRLYASVPL